MSGRVWKIQLNTESTCRLPFQSCGMPDASHGVECKMAAANGLGRAFLARERCVRQSPRRRWTWVRNWHRNAQGPLIVERHQWKSVGDSTQVKKRTCRFTFKNSGMHDAAEGDGTASNWNYLHARLSVLNSVPLKRSNLDMVVFCASMESFLNTSS